jgi:Na+-transporting methylmalonyl-CoA/oxaloacetate decarboxylase gamma subunit
MVAVWVGLELTIYGMALVFGLLAVLWGVISLLVRLDARVARVSGGPSRAATVSVAGDPGGLDPALLAAVVIACRAHRMTRRKQAAPEMRIHEPGSLPSRWVGSGRTRQNRSWAPGGRYA